MLPKRPLPGCKVAASREWTQPCQHEQDGLSVRQQEIDFEGDFFFNMLHREEFPEVLKLFLFWLWSGCSGLHPALR